MAEKVTKNEIPEFKFKKSSKHEHVIVNCLLAEANTTLVSLAALTTSGMQVKIFNRADFLIRISLTGFVYQIWFTSCSGSTYLLISLNLPLNTVARWTDRQTGSGRLTSADSELRSSLLTAYHWSSYPPHHTFICNMMIQEVLALIVS